MTTRSRPDRCPGVMRPWIADDGALVRLRLIGGRLSRRQLADLARISSEYADGDLFLTRRANVQLRGIGLVEGELPPAFVEAVTAAGLLPAPSHELVRNVMVSPLSGLLGGRADLRPVAEELDRLVCADPALANLSARFLIVLDDGRGDVVDRPADVGAVAVDADHAQVRWGADGWGAVVPLEDLAGALLEAARAFLEARGEGSAWHVDELTVPLALPAHDRDPRTRVHAAPPGPGMIVSADGRRIEHLPVAEGRLRPDAAAEVLARSGDTVIVTPWRSLLLLDLETT